MLEKLGSPAISSTYPDGWGLGTSVQVNVTGIVTVAPLAGERGVGGGGSGALKERVKVTTFDGTPAMPLASTAVTRTYQVPWGMLSPKSIE
jgi:hypothetical protein